MFNFELGAFTQHMPGMQNMFGFIVVGGFNI